MEQSKVVLVTGSSSGFGRLIAETLARQGHQVYASLRDADGRNAAAGAELRELAAAENLSLQVVELDVTDDASVDREVNRITQESGRIDVLVNNAGAAYMGPAEAFTVEQVRQQFDTNFFSIVRMNRAVLPHMRHQGSGLLVYISSVLGRLVFPFTGIYNSSKFAVEGLAEAYRYELGPLGIDTAIVEPGAYPTSLFGRAATPDDADRLAGYGALAPIQEQMTAGLQEMLSGANAPNPQDVADVVAALVNTPSGQRALRTLVGQDAVAATQLNQVAEQTQYGLLAQFGLQDLTQVAGPEPLAT